MKNLKLTKAEAEFLEEYGDDWGEAKTIEEGFRVMLMEWLAREGDTSAGRYWRERLGKKYKD